MTDLLEDEFGDIIGKARFGLNLSAADVAGQVGISTDDLEVLEDCARSPTKAESDALAALLNLDPERCWPLPGTPTCPSRYRWTMAASASASFPIRPCASISTSSETLQRPGRRR